MTVVRLARLSIVLLAASTLNSYAGPCTSQIEQTIGRIEAKLGAQATVGSSTAESSSARLHRQPTPNSVASAEEALGEVSSDTVKLVKEAMARARAADAAGDEKACTEALAQVQRTLGP